MWPLIPRLMAGWWMSDPRVIPETPCSPVPHFPPYQVWLLILHPKSRRVPTALPGTDTGAEQRGPGLQPIPASVLGPWSFTWSHSSGVMASSARQEGHILTVCSGWNCQRGKDNQCLRGLFVPHHSTASLSPALPPDLLCPCLSLVSWVPHRAHPHSHQCCAVTAQ